MKYAVYRSASSPVDANRSSNLVALLPAPRLEYSDTILHAQATRYYYAVSALDKGNNESSPSVERGVVLPALADLARQFQSRNQLGGLYRDPRSSIVYFPYELASASPVFVKILDAANTEVVTVVDANQTAGVHIAAADLSRLQQGTYEVLFISGGLTEKRPLVVGK